MVKGNNDNEQTEYAWCMFCERTCKRGDRRLVNGKELCPYEGCVGDTDLDSREWDFIRIGREDRVMPPIFQDKKIREF
jgi:hypothetical protein